jgi:predicted phage terminase large subunit-like protein
MTTEMDNMICKSFLAFAMKAHAQSYHGAQLNPDSYVKYVSAQLERVARGETKRLVIALPPRHAKTFLGSICLAAWILAHNPGTKILILSYGQDLADKIAYSIRAILKSAWFLRLFKTRIAKDRAKVKDFITTAGGGVRSISIDGGVTGVGADYILIDDPVQIKDSDNDRQLERVNDLFDNEIRTRLNNPKKGAIVIVAHRLAESDLAGHVLQQGGWTHIHLPLVAPRSRRYEFDGGVWHRKKGTLLRPDAFSARDIKNLRLAQQPGFETLQQQNPEARAFLRIGASHFGAFDPAALASDRAVVLSIDPGQKGGSRNSFSVVQAWAAYQEKRHALLDQWRAQAPYKEFRGEVRRFVNKYRPSAILVEATGQGPALISEIGPRTGMEIIQTTPWQDKVSRLRPHIKLVRAGNVLLPQNARWVDEFLAEVVDFPNDLFDDQVDAMTQFLDWISKNPYPQKRPLQALIAGAHSNGQPFVRTNQAPRSELRGLVVVRGRRR